MSEELRKLRDNHDDFDSQEVQEQFQNPLDQFSRWFDDAASKNTPEVNAMVVSTVNSESQPSSRTVYLKELDQKGLVFFTNYNSDKGKDLVSNPKASALFFWPNLHQQIHIRGRIEKIDSVSSDIYFSSRPRESKLGAWASNQSEVLKDRSELQERLAYFNAKFPSEIPRPPHWGGYRLIPNYFEFWQGRPSRLHDRYVFVFENEQWTSYFKNP